MQYKPEELLELQDTLLEILQHITRICEEENITYFTVGGTTLGTIRHNGFIPWDDDIDIGMMRDDYERFLEIAPSRLGEEYILQHFRTDPNTPTYFAKVRKNGTLFVEEAYKDLNIHKGIFVDIMPYDRIPDDKKDRHWHRMMSVFWRELYHAKSVTRSCINMAPWKMTAIKAIRSVIHFILIPIPKKCLYDILDKRLRKYNSSGSSMISSRAYDMFNCNYEDIFPVKQHQFSGIMVNIPADSNRILEIQYGNYMQLPPENKRISHSPLVLKVR